MACEQSSSPSQSWARPGSEGGTTGAYLSYTNELDVPDTLLSLISDASPMVQLHESYLTGDGLSAMREMKKPVLDPGETLLMQPGGLHIMLMQLRQDISVGDSLGLTLVFSHKGSVRFQLPVRTNQ